jgi:RAD51-like protein 2
MEECKIKPEDALLVLKSVKTQDFIQDQPTLSSQTSILEGKSALELLKKETQLPPIVTCNEAIDKMLGGGVPLGKMTEFCGIPGIGKTQVGYDTLC